MPINESWNIRSRAKVCHKTGQPFEDGESFYTAIFKSDDDEDFRRLDFSKAAWNKHLDSQDTEGLFSFWRSTFEKNEPLKGNEAVTKESAEVMLRRLIDENEAASENARYILVVMLERKKLLKPVDIKEDTESRMLFYEHSKTGEAFIVRDPLLKLAELDAIQEEVTGWLGKEKNDAIEPDDTTGNDCNLATTPESSEEEFK